MGGQPQNGVLIAGYAVEHTLAKEITAPPKEVVTLEGRRQPLNCLVGYISFSAHVAPKHIILVPGQKDEMGRLKSSWMLQYKSMPENKRPTITMPPNLQEVKLCFARRRSAKVMGTLAAKNRNSNSNGDRDRDVVVDNCHHTEPVTGELVRGILVTHNFHSKIVAPQDFATYTPLRVGTIASKLHVPFSAGSINTLKVFLTETFSGIEMIEKQQTATTPPTADGTSSSGAGAGEATVFKLGNLVQVLVGRRGVIFFPQNFTKTVKSKSFQGCCFLFVDKAHMLSD